MKLNQSTSSPNIDQVHAPLKISWSHYGGEDIREVGQRVLKTVLEKAEEHTKDGAENLLFVSHGAALWGLIIFMDLAFPEGVGFGNCNVCVYDYNQGQLELLQVIDPISGLEVTL